jgi:hypothetical protein
MKRLAATLLLLLAAVPARAQDLSFRPFLMFTEERFAAVKSFEGAFGKATQPMWGGGLNITSDDRFYLEVSASRFKKSGTRSFFFDGNSFDLGIRQEVTITPLEFTAGYRFLAGSRFIPSAGAGVGVYKYKQVSDFSTDAENVDTRHAGLILEGGVEVRLHRWFGVAADVHYAHVPGILGDDGFSKDAGEKDLGGVSGRIKVIVGR